MGAKYNYEVGKLYDIIFYIVIRLFEEAMIERVFKKYSHTSNLEHDLRFFYELKNQCPEISDKLKPLCYCNPQQISFLIRYVGDHINFDNGTLDDLIVLFSDIEKGKQYFVDIYFPKLIKSDREKLYKTNDIEFISSVITKTEIEEKYHCAFLVFLAKYETYIPVLIQTVKTIYPYIDRLHNRNAEAIQNIVERLKDSALVQKIYKNFAITEEKQNVFMFSLLNPYGVNFRKKPFNHTFRIGENFLTTVSFESDYDHVTYESFAKILLSSARAEIFRMFFKYDYLCAGDIVNELKLSKYTVYAHLNDMLYEKILIHINVGGAALRYSLNEDYLLKFGEYNNKETHNYIDKKRKGDLKHYVRPRKRRKDAQD